MFALAGRPTGSAIGWNDVSVFEKLGPDGEAGAGAAITAAAPAKSSGQTISFTEHPVSDQSFNLGSGHGDAVGAIELGAGKRMQGCLSSSKSRLELQVATRNARDHRAERVHRAKDEESPTMGA